MTYQTTYPNQRAPQRGPQGPQGAQQGPQAPRPAAPASAARPADRPAAQAEGTVNIRGKEYVLVAQRVKLAHAAGGFTMLGSEVVELGATGRLFSRVTIEVNGKQYIGSSEVKLDAKPGTPDGEAPLECAETSALGRALGFAGFASAQGIASAEEVIRAAVGRGS